MFARSLATPIVFTPGSVESKVGSILKDFSATSKPRGHLLASAVPSETKVDSDDWPVLLPKRHWLRRRCEHCLVPATISAIRWTRSRSWWRVTGSGRRSDPQLFHRWLASSR